jgi:hypothetical protein
MRITWRNLDDPRELPDDVMWKINKDLRIDLDCLSLLPSDTAHFAGVIFDQDIILADTQGRERLFRRGDRAHIYNLRWNDNQLMFVIEVMEDPERFFAFGDIVKRNGEYPFRTVVIDPD